MANSKNKTGGKWFKMRVISDEGELLEKVTEKTGVAQAEFVRRLIRTYAPTAIKTGRIAL